MKTKNMATSRYLVQLSLVAVGVSTPTGCDQDMEGGEDYVDFQLSDDKLVPNDYTPRDFPDQHVEDSTDIIEYKITNSEHFIKPISLLAHYLGYGWVGGNNSQYVGKDMVARQEGDRIIVQGNNEGDCEGYWCEKKTKLIFSDFKYTMDGDSFHIPGGTGAIVTEPSDEEPLVLTGKIVNLSDRDQMFVGHIIKDMNTNWSKTNTHGFSYAVGLESEFTVPVVGKAKVSHTFGTDHSWGNTNGGSDTTQVKAEVRATVPARSVMPFVVTLQSGKVTFPYQASVIVSYDVTLEGFLRYRDEGADPKKAGHAHPSPPSGDRPDYSYTFTVGRATTDQRRDIDHQWTHRGYFQEEGWWDWDRAIAIAGGDGNTPDLEEGERKVEQAARDSIWPHRLLLEGVFTADSAWEANAIYGEVTYLDDVPQSERPTQEGIFGDDGNDWQEGEGPE